MGGVLAAMILAGTVQWDGAGTPNETYLIGGRIRLKEVGARQPLESRRFELTIRRRGERVIAAEACFFADVSDRDWKGRCFALMPASFIHFDFQSLQGLQAPVPTDRAAQQILRVLASEGNPLLRPYRELAGYDVGVPLDVHVQRFVEGDL